MTPTTWDMILCAIYGVPILCVFVAMFLPINWNFGKDDPYENCPKD